MATANVEETQTQEISSENSERKKPVCMIVLGMAGSGKTTFVQRLTAHLHSKKNPPYVINLDPACRDVPYPANVDIRDTVNYKEVMKHYSLGPNGAIVTSLNLFATKFDQVIKLLDKRSSQTEYVIFDTPGQIEVFTWSASGNIITETLAASFPTVVVYVMDMVRSVSPITFMSNMVYACSILYKTKLPFIIVMNKVDVVSHNYAVDWMKDFEVYEESLKNDTSYNANLARSLSLALDDFYKDLRTVGVSAITGTGMEEFLASVASAKEEYETDYREEYERLKALRDKAEMEKQKKQMERLEQDLEEADRLTTGRSVSGASEAYLRHAAVGGESSDEEAEVRREDSEDEEERREAESFRNFLEAQKQRQQAKANNAP